MNNMAHKEVIPFIPEKNIESLSAKIRNKLTPYWNLTAMLKSIDSMPADKKDALYKIILSECDNIDRNKKKLLKLVDSINQFQ
jgi:hypothetical protein